MSIRDDSNSGRRAWRVIRGAVLVTVLIALAPAAAQASPPRITHAPEVAGTPQVGQTLRAEGAEWDGDPEPKASWQWMRCRSADLDDCSRIGGATSVTYTVREADEGRRLRVMLTVRNKQGSAWALSFASEIVAPAPLPTPSPTPSPEPTPERTPVPESVVTPAPAAPLAPAVPEGAVLPGAAASPKLMKPVPLVRIRGRLSRKGAQITLLTVEAPRGARIAIRCIGRGCPARRWAKTTAVTRIARFQRDLRAGTKLIVTVTKPGRIGKHTTILIRAGKAPARRDRCLMPGSGRPVACPSV